MSLLPLVVSLLSLVDRLLVLLDPLVVSVLALHHSTDRLLDSIIARPNSAVHRQAS